MKAVLASTVMGLMMMAPSAFAHSDYWRCAAMGGSYADVARRCGSRSNFDRTGRVGPDYGYGRGGWDNGYGRGGYGRGGWDNGYGRGRHGGRWNLTSVEATAGSCFSAANGQGEEIQNVSAEACEAMGGQSFVGAEQ